MNDGLLCISADSHVVEPPELFEPLKKRFGDQAPHVRVADPARGPQLDLGNGQLGIGISGFFMANVDFAAPETRELLRKGYDLARPGVYNVSERLKDQDIDQIDAEVLYPSVMFNVYQIQNLDIVKASFATYNDWISDYCNQAPTRLFPLACLQLWDIDAAIEEMRRAKAMGHVGVCIPCTAPPDKLYSDRAYDKFWAAAQEMDMPLTMHVFTGATPNHGLPFKQAGYALAFTGVIFTVADIIQSGVCERFPRLKFVVTEFETGWIGIMLKRLDWTYKRSGGATTNEIPHQPSFYWKRNFLATFEDDDIGIKTRDLIGTQSLIWGNDYPHGDAVFPESPNVLNKILGDLTQEEIYQMTVENAVKLHNLPFELKGPDQARIKSKKAVAAR